MGWLQRWPELRDVIGVSLGAVVILVLLGVWVVTGRVPPWEMWTLGGGLVAGPTALAARRIISTGSSSQSPEPPSLPSSPSSPPLPGAPDGGG